MADADLLPCPFCGGAAEIEPWHGGGPEKRLIACAADNICEAAPSVTGETEAEAIANWNRRAESAESKLAEVTEALRPFLRVAEQMKGRPADEFVQVESEMSHEEDAALRAEMGLEPTPDGERRTTNLFSLDGLRVADWLRLAALSSTPATPPSREPALTVEVGEMRESGDRLSYYVTLYRPGDKPWDGMSIERCPTREDAEAEAQRWREFFAPVINAMPRTQEQTP